jgi:adenylate cyclase
MHAKQHEINARWGSRGPAAFGLGLGLSTGEAAAALLGSEERLEYTLVGDTVNMSQRLQQLAAAGETVLSEGPEGIAAAGETVALPAATGEGTRHPGVAYRLVGEPDPSTVHGAKRKADDMDALVVDKVSQDLRGRERPGAGAARRQPDPSCRPATSSP